MSSNSQTRNGEQTMRKDRRNYPKFVPGMTTRDYVRQYFVLNSWRQHKFPEGGPYGPNMVDIDALYTLSDRPAPMLDPNEPEVVECSI
jgi:hypothetical protein